jgi:endonuclease-3
MPRRKLDRDAPAVERAPEIIRRLEESYPDSHTALRFSDPLEMLVATILSAQSTDANVNRVTQTLFQKYRTPEDYLRVPVEELANDIHSTGFFNQKTKAIRGACARIIETYDGRVPDTMEELVTLPGVARKTANVVLGTAFGIADGVVVDTHIQRLAMRLGLTRATDPKDIERDLMKVLPRETWIRAGHQLIWHGRRVCFARKPNCAGCTLAPFCPSAGLEA